MAKLKKELGLFDVYAIATGATLSSGFFLLPGIAAAEAGGMLPVSYLAAGACLMPGLLSMAELSTAMPRAGGIYYFLARSMGPMVGTVGGFVFGAMDRVAQPGDTVETPAGRFRVIKVRRRRIEYVVHERGPSAKG